MTTDTSSDPAATAGVSTDTASPNVDPNAGAAAPQSAGTQAAPPAPGAPGTPPPQYTPNYKYKAAEKEMELDKFWHPLIKDGDSEKKVKDIFQKVHAFDFMKEKRQFAETQFDSLLADYNGQAGMVNKFQTAVKGNDLTSAFRMAGISRDQVFRWTQQQLQMMELPPDQRAAMERAEMARLDRMDMDERMAQMQQRFEDQAVQTRTVQLEVVLGRPDVQSFAANWDQASGTPGAFRQLVIEEGRRLYYDQGLDISPEQAIANVMARFKHFSPGVNPGGQPVTTVHQSGGRPNPPVIPNVTGKAASPIKKVPRSLDDLKKLAKEMRD